jgi:NTP pyrophosphatase (non-canonical NTP hydrolase)
MIRIRDFQQHIELRYAATDRQRGWAKTFAYFIEEVGELATALARESDREAEEANLREEFADVLAWLCTLANIRGVDLESAIREKYLEGSGPAGIK